MRWRRVAVAIASTALAASCTSDDEAREPVAEASAAPCADNDIECLNRQWVVRFAEEDRRQPKLPLDRIFGNWIVVAALAPEGRSMDGTWVTTYAHRDEWIGSEVSLTRAAITIDATDGAAVIRADGMGPGALYPRCTNPAFDTDQMNSASPVEQWIDLWRHFGFDKPVVGRPALVHCNGALEFPDDGSGHRAEMTVEEAHGIEVLYLYDPDNLIVQWGELEFLLHRRRG